MPEFEPFFRNMKRAMLNCTVALHAPLLLLLDNHAQPEVHPPVRVRQLMILGTACAWVRANLGEQEVPRMAGFMHEGVSAIETAVGLVTGRGRLLPSLEDAASDPLPGHITEAWETIRPELRPFAYIDPGPHF